MNVFTNSALAGASGQGGAGGYAIDRSLRFNSADSAHLSKTFASAGNRKTWTWSSWVKKTNSASYGQIFAARTSGSSNPYSYFYWNSDDSFTFIDQDSSGGRQLTFKSTKLFRDPSAWYHLVVVWDTTNTTQADRFKFYVNGIRHQDNQLSWVYPDLDDLSGLNSTSVHGIGRPGDYSNTDYLDGYLADVQFIDGQALSATDFGEYDDNNVWQPIKYAGTYGTNGFKLDFSDTSSDSALGTDSSGAGNNWSVNNLSALEGNGNYLTGTITGSPWDASYTFNNLFNGSTVGLGAQSNGGLNYTLNFSPALTGTSIYVITNGVGVGNSAFAFNGTTATSSNTTLQAGGQPPHKYLLNSVTSLSSITVGSVVNTTAIEIDGVILIDNSLTDPDALRDSPVNGDSANDTGAGGEITGNYATWNPLFGENQSLSNGNLKAESNTTDYAIIASTIAMKSGKWYMEYTYTFSSSEYVTWGISQTNRVGTQGSGVTDTAEDKGFKAWDTGFYSQSAGSTIYNYSSSVSSGDIISLAFDADAGKLWVAKNGTYMTNASGAGNPTAGTNPDYSGLNYSGGYYFMAGPYNTNGSTLEANFGQRAFAYAAPSGYKCLNTANLSDPTIADGSQYFDTKLYTGNGGTQSITGLSFQPDFVWTKNRSSFTNQTHALFDSIRGKQMLASNSTNSEANWHGSNGLPYRGYVDSFDSNGFSLVPNAASNLTDYVNYNNTTYVAWAWDAGSSTVTNTDGSISSQVRANPSAGFSIVSYTGTGANASFGHGLNAAPELVVIKGRNFADSWHVYHKDVFPKYLRLSTTDAEITNTAVYPSNPSSSVVNIGSDAGLNTNNKNLIAYCFAPVEGYSAFGTYVGNGSNDGVFVHTGFSVKWLLTKASSAGSDWQLWDASRQPYNVNANTLAANTSGAESGTSGYAVDLLSNGFKFRMYGSSSNASGVTYVWAAFAEHPFKSSRAR